MSTPTTYLCPAQAASAEFKDRGSRFLAYVWPVADLQEIKNHLQVLKKEHPKAIHHCLAWRLGTDGTQFRANDDGEPSGSAGKPILGQIDSLGLTQVLVVVVRYWGGTLLGVPGLIHAYKTSAQQALQAAGILTKAIERTYRLEFDYTIQNEVMRVLKQHHCTIRQQAQQLFVNLELGIPLSELDDVLLKLQDLPRVTIEGPLP